MKSYTRSLGTCLSAAFGMLLLLASPAHSQSASRAIDRATMDTTCGACTDFSRYANGAWIARTAIPASYSSMSAGRELRDRNQVVLREILEGDAAAVRARAARKGSAEWKVGAFYSACMDTVAVARRGAAPLAPELGIIAGIRSPSDLPRALASLERSAGIAPWADGSAQDSKDASSTIAGLYQGGLSLPTNEYYTKTDTASVALRRKFTDHVARMFVLLGHAPATASAEAQTVLDLETRLARASKTPVDLRNPTENYHRMGLAQLDSLSPHFSFTRFYRALGVARNIKVDVGQPGFVQGFDTLVSQVPLENLKTLLRWRAVHAAAPALSPAFANEGFEFTRLFSGAKEMLPRWKQCATATDERIGELLGQEYVKRAFPPEAKARAVTIVDNLVKEFRIRIAAVTWMSDPTKTAAIEKLDAFTRKIGYPDKWIDYSQLVVRPDDYYANMRASTIWNSRRDVARIGKPTDRAIWYMTPPTVDAYTNPLLNEIVFPAGILQPPYFDPKADDAVNYGAMGAVIGHEMSHEFDDQGRQYDARGNLRDWWVSEDAARFNTEAEKIVKQFDAYTVLDPDTHVNGRLTLGENLGDFGGLTIAYAAMERALGNGPRPVIDGFTPEQRFFLSWAQSWRVVIRPEALRAQVNSNEHAPSQWRANGPLSNMPEFRAAWGCKAGDPMARPDALIPRIW